MYNYSVAVDGLESQSFGINNIELKDGCFGAKLANLTLCQIEDIRNKLISYMKKIVLYTAAMHVSQYERYIQFFRNAHLLNIENVKIEISAFDDETGLKELSKIIEIAAAFDIKVLFEPDTSFSFDTYKQIKSSGTGIIFNPLKFVKAGENPFLTVLYNNKFKDDIVFLKVNDGLYNDSRPVMLEEGNSEIKECVSAMLARSYKGYFSFEDYMQDNSVSHVIRQFSDILFNM
jgi:sugar phosphate isomerase/epimerase